MIGTVLVALTKEAIEKRTKEYMKQYNPCGYGTTADDIVEMKSDGNRPYPPMIYQAKVKEINGLDEGTGKPIIVNWDIITDDEHHFLEEINNRIIRHVHNDDFKITITYKCFRTKYFKRVIKRFESCD
jgi:hypothetical protein